MFVIVTADKLKALVIRDDSATPVAKGDDHMTADEAAEQDEGEILSDEDEEGTGEVGGAGQSGSKQPKTRWVWPSHSCVK